MRDVLQSNWEARAARCIQAWELNDVVWRPQFSTARIADCLSAQGPAILKVSIEPNLTEIEAIALDRFGTELSPAVWQRSIEEQSLLTRRIDVLQDLSDVYPSPEAEIDIWFPFYERVVSDATIPAGFPTLTKFAVIFDRVLQRPLRPAVAEIMRWGRDLSEILMIEPENHRLLHGDMHHFNILCDLDQRWWLIDPSGVIGHPHYEVGAFIRNPMPRFYTEPGTQEKLNRRLDILAERMNISRQTVAEYGFYGCAFSLAWDIEEGDSEVDNNLVRLAEACLRIAKGPGKPLSLFSEKGRGGRG